MATQRKKKPAPKRKSGGQDTFTQAKWDAICHRIANGESLRQIGRSPGMPTRPTVLKWLDTRPNLRDQYAKARQDQQDAFAEEILEIADDGRNDWIERENERTGEKSLVLNREAVSRSALRVDARKWLMARLAPKKYGDKIGLDNESLGDIGKLLAMFQNKPGNVASLVKPAG